MFVGTILKQISIYGYIQKGLCEVHSIKSRHDMLAEEMIKRGYTHNSFLPSFNVWEEGYIDIENSYTELLHRCPECRSRYEELFL
jgi:hypothetical protein